MKRQRPHSLAWQLFLPAPRELIAAAALREGLGARGEALKGLTQNSESIVDGDEDDATVACEH